MSGRYIRRLVTIIYDRGRCIGANPIRRRANSTVTTQSAVRYIWGDSESFPEWAVSPDSSAADEGDAGLPRINIVIYEKRPVY